MTTKRVNALIAIGTDGIFGAEKVVIGLIQRIANLGGQITLVLWSSVEVERDIRAELSGLSIEVFNLKKTGIKTFANLIDNHHVTILHAHGSKAGISCLMAKILCRKPVRVVFTVHGYGFPKRLTKGWIYEAIDKFLLRFYDYVVFVAESQKKSLNRLLFSKGKSVVIQNGLHMDELPGRHMLVRSAPPDGKFMALAIGRLDYVKGFDLLIKALGILKQQGIHVGLMIVGEGSEKRSLSYLIEKYGLKEDVELFGYQSDTQSFYYRASFLVVSSRSEGLPMVVLEAAMSALPILTTDVGDISNVLESGDCGVKVDAISPKGIAEGIQNMMRYYDREVHRAFSAREKISTTFSLDSMAEKYISVYEKVAP